jgi:hypothetical protein
MWSGLLRASREGKRHDLARVEATHLQTAREVLRKVGGRATIRAVEPAHHTMLCVVFTPFFMVHVLKAVLPMDIDYGSPQV